MEGADPVAEQRRLPVLSSNMKAQVLAYHRYNEKSVEKVPVAVEHTGFGELAPTPEVSFDRFCESLAVQARESRTAMAQMLSPGSGDLADFDPNRLPSPTRCRDDPEGVLLSRPVVEDQGGYRAPRVVEMRLDE